jgi:hypothetical protein
MNDNLIFICTLLATTQLYALLLDHPNNHVNKFYKAAHYATFFFLLPVTSSFPGTNPLSNFPNSFPSFNMK